MANVGSVLDALRDDTRRDIFERLAARPRAVTELAAGLPVSRPAVSQHLRVLRDAGLVDFDSDGTRRVYRVRVAGLDELRSYLDKFWDTALTSFKRRAEATAKKRT